jgi:hypothetical protein
MLLQERVGQVLKVLVQGMEPLSIEHGRKMFRAQIADVLALVDMDRSKPDAMTAEDAPLHLTGGNGTIF